jgi:CHAD domain-containing protein
MTDSSPMRFLQRETDAALRRVAFQATAVHRDRSKASIHQLRVAIRRFDQCLRTFAPAFEKAAIRRIRGKLEPLRRLAGATRDIDIALDLMKEAGLAKDSPVVEHLKKQRAQSAKDLKEAVEPLIRRGLSRKWRERLAIP